MFIAVQVRISAFDLPRRGTGKILSALVPFCELPLAAVDAHALLQWLGRTHVVVVHFPITLLLIAGLAGLWRGVRGAREPSKFAVLCVGIGTLAAAWAVAAGLAHESFSEFSGEAAQTRDRHEWLGISAAVA